MINSRYPMNLPNRVSSFAPPHSVSRVKEFKLPILLTLVHIPFGILLYNAGAIALLHPYGVFLLGMHWAFRKHEKLEKTALIVAYMIGVEVLWRMANLPVYWEFGKYAASLIMITALLRRGCTKIPTLPLVYFILLLPSCVLTLTLYEWRWTQQMLSFNMSGPLLLFVSCWFFSHLKITWSQLKTLFFSTILPLLSVAVTTLFYTVMTADIQFTTESNHATSGGFGPNQVSATLGLGAFFCIAGYLLFKNRFRDNLYLGLLTVLFAAQSVMTFSRGGMYNAVGASLAVVLFQVRNPSRGIKRLLPVLALAAIFLLLVFPYLNRFTGGSLQARFEESDPTNRYEIVESDLQIFLKNPVFGVGVGESAVERTKIFGAQVASHTEFARIISEHGIFGVFALVALGLMFVGNLQRQTSSEGKALVAGLIVWSSLFMLNAGMRLAAPAFIFGLSFLTVTELQMRKKKFPKTKTKYALS
jgi:hypothetical protein